MDKRYIVNSNLEAYSEFVTRCDGSNQGKSMSKKPGDNTGKDGGIFQETGPRGGKKDNFAAIPDNKTVPPTSKPGNTWTQVVRTPDSTKK